MGWDVWPFENPGKKISIVYVAAKVGSAAKTGNVYWTKYPI
jgi:hypothetical protein